MKNLLVILILFISIVNAGAQIRWEQISYFHSSGPVSPEYQYNYNIKINSDGTGVLEYTFKGFTTNYDFNVSRSGLNNLNNALTKSQVLDVSMADLKSDKNLIGGSVYNATITMPYSEPTEEYIERQETKKKLGKKEEEELDENGVKTKGKKPIVLIPNNVNEKYSEGIHNFYLAIEKLVPNSAWSKATDMAE